MTQSMPRHVLDGYRVLDFTHYVAGPTVTRLMAEMGAEGIKIVKALVPKVDVMVENFAPGVIASMGLGYEDVKALNPKIVMCSVSTFGQTGPLSKDPGFDFIGKAYAGITSLIGEKDGPPY